MTQNTDYGFTPELAFKTIEQHWKTWDTQVKPKTYVIGISGGIDSTCVAALACKIFGKERVIGVSLPCDGQKDMADVDKVFELLGLKRVTIDIGDMLNEGLTSLENQALEVTDTCKTNMPARLRMVMLYGVAQCTGGVMVNTCQLSEDVCGYSTLFGDNAGSYAPLKELTKTEVKAISEWLGIPSSLVFKAPQDGLQPLTDEQKLGISYDKVDNYIRNSGSVSVVEESKILELFYKNKFKLEIVKIPGPQFINYPNRFREL